jgi:hypothetical protein
MRKAPARLFLTVVVFTLLTGCSGVSNLSNLTPPPSADSAPVTLSMTDDPPNGVQVLFFQVSLTAASLTPMSGSPVSLLSNNTPIQVDVTQLQALSAFLSTANVSAGTYNSLSLTFSNPELVIFNQSDASLGSSCAVGSVCQLTPAIDDNSATVTYSSSPFPLTISSGSTNPLGLLVDFHLNTVIQSDLSVNLGVANGISIDELPSTPQPRFGTVAGEVESVSASNNDFTILTQWGRTFTVATSSSTSYDDFPSSACSSAGFACVADGQVVQVQVTGVASGGVLNAGQVTFVQAAGTQTAEGTVVGIEAPSTSGGTYEVKMILHRSPMASTGVPLGGEATVTIASTATYAVDNNGFSIPSGLNFTGTPDLLVGQNLQVIVENGTLSSTNGSAWGGWGPPQAVSFTTTSVELEPSQLSGTITALNSPDFTIDFGQGPFFAAWPMAASSAPTFDVITSSGTTYQGFSPESFAGLATQDFVSVSGWLFPPATSSGPPQLAAQSVALHSGGWF